MSDTKQNVRSVAHDSADELTLDDANEMSFPASDPIATSNVSRVDVAPDMSPAAADHPQAARTQQTEQRARAPQAAKQATDAGLDQIRIAVLVTDGFEQAELLEPKKALEAAGAQVDIISDKADSVQGFEHTKKGVRVHVDKSLNDARSDDYAAVLLPGGVVNGDAMRMMPQARSFVQQANRAKKPIASICHGGWLLISAGIAENRTVTSWPSLQDDFRNAGGNWIDEEVVRDDNFVSSRKPDDIPAFNQAFISLLHDRQTLTSGAAR
jgi:protease I